MKKKTIIIGDSNLWLVLIENYYDNFSRRMLSWLELCLLLRCRLLNFCNWTELIFSATKISFLSIITNSLLKYTFLKKCLVNYYATELIIRVYVLIVKAIAWTPSLILHILFHLSSTVTVKHIYSLKVIRMKNADKFLPLQHSS